ncbi:MAG TPA: asparagine synthase (glutamine-hydrolyzing) [Bryobacteraceae bacterium]|nr:asparagine synthase (glutamine-hydrolyzing) [Bryobacteraceae bacterium]
MCAIAGFVNLDKAAASPAILGRMIRAVEHRGPDATGLHAEANLALGHARLSIIDLAGGAQPMKTRDGSLWIVFNGEIFNYLELRAELMGQGCRFDTQSDTEVLLRLYEKEGQDCVQRLNGQWAFAIWDAKQRRLFLSRDRAGVRPLFYTFTNRAFLFASEIKSLLTHPDVPRELNLAALDEIFTFWCRIGAQTVFKNILELPPGHSLMVEASAQGRNAVPRRYWKLDFTMRAPQPDEDSAARLQELLVDATRIRLRSDVPVGAYLSGGLDSTITTALIRNFSSAHLKTFSVSFDDSEFDESRYQQIAARYLETEHQDVRCTAQDIAAVFPEVIWHTEQPVLRTAPAPMYLLSKLVRSNGYKVVLTGEGADEMLGGYDIFKEAKIRRFCAAHPESKLRPLLLKRLYPYLQDIQRQPSSYLRAFFHAGPEDLASPFFSHIPRWNLTSGIKLFFSEEAQAAIGPRDCYAEMEAALPEAYASWDSFSQAQYLEASYLMPGYILSSQGDRMSMAHAVEGRFPFLDYRVMELSASLPPSLKMKGIREKYLLKQSVNGLIPAAIKRRTKQPYRAPEGKSFFCQPQQEYIQDLLSPDRIRAGRVFNPAAVQALVQKFQQDGCRSIRENMAMCGILSTQLVIDQFIRKLGRSN